MSNYTKAVDFASKDALAPGNPSKVVKGVEIDAEFEAIETAVNSKANAASPTFSGIINNGGGQLLFPAAQNPSADVNTLDDYEEGVWTPSDVSGAGLVITGSDCYYTKIGNLVTVFGKITYPVTADGSTANIGGLPFTSRSGSEYSGGGVVSHPQNVATGVLVVHNAARFGFYLSGAAKTNLGMSAQSVLVNLSYFAAA